MREMEQAHPLIRIHLYGEFMVECLQPSSPSAPTTPTAPRYERVPHEEWRSRGPAMALLKVLLCHPRRRASRDTLIELLWPSVEEGASSHHAFDSAVSILRKVLRTAQGESLLTKVRSGGVTFYALPHQHYVWVDADAFEQTIDQAMKAERRGEDPLPLWEAAYRLGTGEFLEDERYSSWAQARRHRLNAARHRCVHRLVELYLARNMTDQAETLLQAVVMDDPTDEDALCRLLLLLQEQGRYQEALQLYQHTVSVLDEEYQTQPSTRTIAIAERLRHGPMGMGAGERAAVAVPTFPAPAVTPLLDRPSSRRQMLQEMLGVAAAALLAPPHELLNPDAWERLSQTISRPTYIDEAVLADLATITQSYWRLRANTSSSDLLNGVLGHFQTTVQMLRTTPATPTADRLCSLAGEIAQVIGQMLFDMQDYATAWTYYKFSLNAAEEATNEVLHTVGLARLSLLLAASGQYQRSIVLLQKAQQGAAQQARIRCWLAVVEAEVQAQLHNVDDCLQGLDLAQQIATSHPFEEDSYATGLNLARLASYKGACLVHLQRPEEALVALQEAEALLDPLAIRRQSRLLTERATAHVQQHEIEEACRLAHQALAMTMQTKSMSVLQRVRRLREHLNAWESLPVVKGIDEHITTTFAVITS